MVLHLYDDVSPRDVTPDIFAPAGVDVVTALIRTRKGTQMTRIGIILGSTRPNRVGGQVAEWVYKVASDRTDADFHLVDLREHPLPHLDEPLPAMVGQYQGEHTKAWANRIASFDGFVFVTAEYNRGVPAVLKNAIDFLFAEWRHKAVGLVSYGTAGGANAAGQLRQICGPLGMVDVSRQVALFLHTDFENFTEFKPTESNAALLSGLLDEVVTLTAAMAPLRAASADV